MSRKTFRNIETSEMLQELRDRWAEDGDAERTALSERLQALVDEFDDISPQAESQRYVCGPCGKTVKGMWAWTKANFVWLGPIDNLWACCGECRVMYNLDGSRKAKIGT